MKVVLLMLMFLVSCNQNTSVAEEKTTTTTLQAEAQWIQGPVAYDESVVEIYLPALEESDLVEAQLWMPSMNHGSSPIKVVRLGAQMVRLESVYFIMPGDWELRLVIKNQQGEIKNRKVWQFDL